MPELTPARSPHRYILELGRGGMGTVYLALAQGPGGFNKLKVVKVLNPELANEPQFLRMFLNEARLSARLYHPNIVQTNEVGVRGDEYFIEMEYLDGQAYSTLIRRGEKAGGVPLEMHLWILTQALAGLHYAHELRDPKGEPLGIVHRDVSPHNIFVTYDGFVKVLDFGIAKAADTQTETRSGAIKGKATYMAPEQVMKLPLGRHTDIFAIGVMLWEAITQKRLWEGLNDFDIFIKLDAKEIPSVRAARPDVAPELEAITNRALSPNPEDRYPTAEAMQAEIEAYLDKTGARVAARNVGKLVSDLFAGRRAAVREEIDRQTELAATQSEPSTVVPQLRETSTTHNTKTGETRIVSATGPGQGAAPPLATVERAPGESTGTAAGVVGSENAEPRRRSRALLVGALAGLTLVGGGGIVASRSLRSAAGVAPPSADPAAVAAGECTLSAECAAKNGGKPSICRHSDHTCAPVDTQDCQVEGLGELLAAKTEPVWLGVMVAAGAKVARNTFELARGDFNGVGGIPGAAVGERHLLGLIVCNATNPQAEAENLARAEVEAVIGFPIPLEKTVAIAEDVFIPHHILMLDVEDVDAALTRIPQPEGTPRLVWRDNYDADEVGYALAALSEQAGGWVQAGAPSRKGATNRLALFRSDAASSVETTNAAVRHLQLNGKPLAQAGDDFKQFAYKLGSGHSVEDDAIVTELVNFGPSLIAYTDVSFPSRFAAKVEERWQTGSRRPTYLSSIILGDDGAEFVGRNADRRHRYFGVELPANTEENLSYVLHYNSKFAPPITPGTAPGVFYDAIYLLAYAAASAHSGAPSGFDLARFMPRLKKTDASPDPIQVGPSTIFDVFDKLKDPSAPLNLTGAGSTLDFQDTGEIEPDFAVYCFGVDAHGTATQPLESGLTIHYRSRVTDGTKRCP